MGGCGLDASGSELCSHMAQHAPTHRCCQLLPRNIRLVI